MSSGSKSSDNGHQPQAAQDSQAGLEDQTCQISADAVASLANRIDLAPPPDFSDSYEIVDVIDEDLEEVGVVSMDDLELNTDPTPSNPAIAADTGALLDGDSDTTSEIRLSDIENLRAFPASDGKRLPPGPLKLPPPPPLPTAAKAPPPVPTPGAARAGKDRALLDLKLDTAESDGLEEIQEALNKCTTSLFNSDVFDAVDVSAADEVDATEAPATQSQKSDDGEEGPTGVIRLDQALAARNKGAAPPAQPDFVAEHPLPLQGLSLWATVHEKRRYARTQAVSLRGRSPSILSSGILQLRAGIEAELESIGLSPASLRYITELIAELRTESSEVRAQCLHAIAMTCRYAATPDAESLARELDLEALVHDPLLFPANMWLISDSWRNEDWEDCVDHLGRFATQLDEVGQSRPDVIEHLPVLYAQLELLMERRLRQPPENLRALCEHAISLPASGLVAPLNNLRHAINLGDEEAARAAFDGLLEKAPPAFAQGLAIEAFVNAWTEGRSATQALKLFLEGDRRLLGDTLCLALAQLLAWEVDDRQAESELIRTWIEAHPQTGFREAIDKRRRSALLYRLNRLTTDETSPAAKVSMLTQAAADHADGIFYSLALRQACAEADNEDAWDGALALLVAHCQSPASRAIFRFNRSALALATRDFATAERHARATLTEAPQALPAEIIRAYCQLATAKAADPLPLLVADTDAGRALVKAELAEWFRSDYPAAFAAYKEAYADGAETDYLLGCLERCAPLAGCEQELAGLLQGKTEAVSSSLVEQHRTKAWRTALATLHDADQDPAQVLERYLQTHGAKPAALHMLFDLHIQRGEQREAEAVLHRIIQSAGAADATSIQEKKLQCAVLRGHPALIQRSAQGLLDKAPEHPAGRFWLQKARSAAGDATQVAEDLALLAASCDDPRRKAAYAVEAAWLLRTLANDIDAALAKLEALAPAGWNWPPLIDMRLSMLTECGHWEAVAAQLEENVEVLPLGAPRAVALEHVAALLQDRLDDGPRARALFQKAIEEDPAAAVGAWREQINALWSSQEWSATLASLQGRLRHADTLSAAAKRIHLREMAFIAANLLGDQEAALSAYQAAIDSPDELFACRGLHRLHRAGGNPAESIAALERIAQVLLDPLERLNCLAQIGLEAQRAYGSVSMEWLQIFAAFAPNHPASERALWQAWDAEHDPRRMAELLLLAPPVATPGDHGLRLLRVGQAYLQGQDFPSATATFAAALTHCPLALPCHLALARVASAQGDREQAARTLHDAGVATPIPWAQRTLLQAALAFQDDPQTQAQLTDALALLPNLADEDAAPLDVNDDESLLAFFLHLHRDLADADAMSAAWLAREIANLYERLAGAPCAEAYPFWRAAARLLGHLREIRFALMRYAHSEALSEEERYELLPYLSGLCHSDEVVEVWLAAAEQCAQREDLEGQQQALEQVLLLNASERRALHRMASALWENGDLETAMAWLQRVAQVTNDLNLRSTVELELALLSETLFARGLEAYEHYARAIEANPNDIALYYFAARNLEQLGEWAAAGLMRAQEAHHHPLSSERSAAFWQAARLYGRRLGLSDEARGLIDHAAEYGDGRLIALDVEIAASLRLPDPIPYLRAFHATQDPSTRAGYAWMLSEVTSDPERQVNWLGHALELDETYLPAALALEQGAPEVVGAPRAIAALVARAALFEDAVAWTEAARRALGTGQSPLAQALLERAIAVTREDELFGPFGPADLYRSLLSRGVPPEQLVALTHQVLARPIPEPVRLRWLKHQGDVFTILGRHEEALACWQEVLALHPNDDESLANLQGQAQQSHDDAAIIAMRRSEAAAARANQPHRAALALLEAARIAQHRLGQKEEARALLDEAQQLAPDALPIGRARLQWRIAAGEESLLIDDLRHALGTYPSAQHPPLHATLAILLHYLQRRPEEAVQHYETFLDGTGFRLLFALDALVLVAKKLGDFAIAKQFLVPLAEEHEDDRVRAALLADIGYLMESAEPMAALEAFQQALSLNPDLLCARHSWERVCVFLGNKRAFLSWLKEEAFKTENPFALESAARALVLADHAEQQELLERFQEIAPEHPLALLKRWRKACQDSNFRTLAELCHSFANSAKTLETAITFEEAALLFASVTERLTSEELLSALLKLNPGSRFLQLRTMNDIIPGEDRPNMERFLRALVEVQADDREIALHWLSLSLFLVSVEDPGAAITAADNALKLWPDSLLLVKLKRHLAESSAEPKILAEMAEREAAMLVDDTIALRCLMQAATIRQIRLNDIPGAIRLLHRILEIEPLHEGAFLALEALYSADGNRTEQHSLLLARADHVKDDEARKRLLARAAQIAADAVGVESAIGDWQRLIAIEPNNIANYQGLARLCIEHEQWEQAVQALQGVIDNTTEHAILSRAYRQMGDILYNLDQHDAAMAALQNALDLDRDDIAVLYRLSELKERAGLYTDCLALWARAYEVEVDYEKRVDLLSRLVRGWLQWQQDPSRAESFVAEHRKLDPQDLTLFEEVSRWYQKHGFASQRDVFIGQNYVYFREHYLNDVHAHHMLHPMLRIAVAAGDFDRAFIHAGMLVALSSDSTDERDFYQRIAKETLHPRPMAINPTLLGKIMPEGLSRGLLELMVVTERSLARVTPQNLHTRILSWRHKIRPASRPETAAMESPALAFNIELPGIYLVPERQGAPTILIGRESALIFEEADLQPQRLAASRFQAALACAATALGVGAFATIDFDTYVTMMQAIGKAIIPEHTFERDAVAAPFAEGIVKVLPKKVRDQLRPWMMQAAEALTESNLVIEYQALINACFRHALLCTPDPSGAIPVVAEMDGMGVFPIKGALSDLLTFMVSDAYAEVRRESLVAVILAEAKGS